MDASLDVPQVSMKNSLIQLASTLRGARQTVLRCLSRARRPEVTAQVGQRLNKCWDQINRLAGAHAEPDVPADFCQPLDLSAFNCRARIGREADGDSWRSVLVAEVCGTVHAPTEGHEVAVRIALSDVTDDAAEPLAVLNRPKQGPLNGSSHFVHQSSMGKLCHDVTVLENWTIVAQLSPEHFVLARCGPRKLKYSVSIVSQETGGELAHAECVGTYENLETGYLDIEDNIQRAKTLAVGLAFSVGAANGQLLDPEFNVICAWVRTNFGSTNASAGARLELDRALQKTATFFRRGGTLDAKQICDEIVEIAPLVGRIEMLDLCLRVAAAKGLVTSDELTLLKNLSDWLEIDRSRLRAMVEKILPVEMHESRDAEMILGVTTEMDKEEARHQLNREYAKWSSRVISSDPSIRRQADQMLQLLAEARTEYVGVKASQ